MTHGGGMMTLWWCHGSVGICTQPDVPEKSCGGKYRNFIQGANCGVFRKKISLFLFPHDLDLHRFIPH